MGVVLTILTTVRSTDAQILFNAAGDAAGNVVGGNFPSQAMGNGAEAVWSGKVSQSRSRHTLLKIGV